MRRAPRNTTADQRANPMGFFADAAVVGPSNAIEMQESRGQRDFVQSDTLPTDVGGALKTQLEQAGVVFGEVVKDDPLFTFVTLPAGWKKVGTDHSMWSDLVDDKGVKRASIFLQSRLL